MKLKIDQVAACLDLPLSTVRRWIRQGRIPIRKAGSEYIFDQPVLEKWAQSHNLIFSPACRLQKPEIAEPFEPLLTVMKRGGVFYDIGGGDVESVLASAVRCLPDRTEHEKKTLHERLMQRELLTSTGIGKGIAIPHPRTPLSDDSSGTLVTTCFLKEPVPFHAVDGQPVFVLFVLLSSTSRRHLHLLSRLSYCVRDDSFIRFLEERPDPETLFARIAEVESRLE